MAITVNDYYQNNATVFVVDDDEAVRESICELMRIHELPVKGYADAWSFLDAVDEEPVGCLLLDVRMPGLSGLGLQKALAAKGIHLPVIIVTGHGDVDTAINAMRQGAADFVCKPVRGSQLVQRVRQILAQEAEHRLARQRQLRIHHRMSRLNEGEWAVLEAVVAGQPNKVIARQLHVSLSTVEARRRRIREKLGTGNLSVMVRMVDCERSATGPVAGQSR